MLMNMKKIISTSLVTFALLFGSSDFYSQVTADQPKLFAPGIVSTEFTETSATFTPDGKTVYFTRSDLAGDHTILTSTFRSGKWGTPDIASFSGVWRDAEPHICPDGSKLYFTSNRPPAPGAAALTTPRGSPGSNIWYVEKKGNGWGEPVHIDGPINAVPSVFSPSVARNGTIYFSGNLPEGGPRNQIYRSVPVNGVYGKPELLSFSDQQWNHLDPSISPDESFMIFGSNRSGNFDLFICFQIGGKWGEPIKFGPEINTAIGSNAPSLGPDGKTLYFTSTRRPPRTYPKPKEKFSEFEKRLRVVENGSRNIWMVDISRWIKQ
jgi:Tol biopolymer transport system component